MLSSSTTRPLLRRSLGLCVLGAIFVASWAPGVARAATLPPLALETLATGLDSPTAITHAGDNRLFISLLSGRVMIWDGERILPQPFLDISDRVLAGIERGLTSIAFHPGYSGNGFLYAHYSNLAGNTVLSRFSVSAADPNRALAATEAQLLEIEQPFGNHNGGQLQFGPDGYLYLGTGDGGAGGDPFCNGQKGTTLLGKMIRLDIDQNVSSPPFHGLPFDNPFLGPGPPRDEIWATGLRNPWRFSFDQLTGDLFIADVGQDTWEEVNRQPAASAGGENYGWNQMEGSSCFSGQANCPAGLPPCNAPAYTLPILEYLNNGSDCSVTGGYVYRGNEIAGLRGVYLYGDFCSGRLWGAEEIFVPAQQGSIWVPQELAPRAPGLTSFGEDRDGELYLVAGGTLSRLVLDEGALPPCVADATTLCLEEGRFRVRVDWRTAQNQGAGKAQLLTDDSGYFWFFNADNPEIFVKVRNACVDPFQRFWVFAAGLTNVEVDLRVRDSETGAERRYQNPLGRAYVAVQDTGAFDTCP